MRRGRLLWMLLAVGLGAVACGGSSKTTPATTTPAAEHALERLKQTGTRFEACQGMREAQLAWIKQIIRYTEIKGAEGTGEGAVLLKADEARHKAEAAAKKVASSAPATSEGVTRYLTAIGTVQTAISEDDQQHVERAVAEESAAAKAVSTTCLLKA